MNVLSWPAIYALELTSACNNRCPGCSNTYAADRTPPPLSAAQWESLLASFAPEAVQLRLTGGEPTLHPGFLRILDAATSYDAWVTVFTNGRWLDPPGLMQQLRGRRRLSGLLVSLHGATSASHAAFSGVRDSFGETLANIRLALDNGIAVALSTVITRRNLHELEAVVDLGEQIGAQQVVFNRYLGAPLPGLEPSHDDLSMAIRRIEAMAAQGQPVKYGTCIPQCFAPNASDGCLAGVAYVAIDPWGRMRPCTHSPTVVGSLLDHPVQELWHSPAMDAWRMLMPQACTACAAYALCHGGCRAIQELRSDGRDPLRLEPLNSFGTSDAARQLPAAGRPRVRARLRRESFGYAVLGGGHVLPVSTAAQEVIDACDGATTLRELELQLGQPSVALLGQLWDHGMLDLL